MPTGAEIMPQWSYKRRAIGIVIPPSQVGSEEIRVLPLGACPYFHKKTWYGAVAIREAAPQYKPLKDSVARRDRAKPPCRSKD